MKKLIFILLFAFSISAQSTKPDDKIKMLDVSINQIKSEINQETDKKNNLLKQYQSRHPDVVEIDSKIDSLRFQLASLEKQKNDLLLAEWLKNLPNNQIELLKIIITQNAKIIDLLEKLQKPL